MGKIIKTIFIIGIALLLVAFLVMGLQTTKSVDSKIISLEAQVNVIDKKRESLTQKTISLEEVKNNLSIQIAMEKDKAAQLELQKSLTALKQAAEDARNAELQALTVARARAVEEARLMQEQALSASPTTKTIRRVVTTQAANAAPSAPTSTTTPTTTPNPSPTPKPAPAPTPAPAPAPTPPSTPPKVTSAS
jgi:hypothetical protein